jgi:HSP20 family molecular chaperone IbpA
MSLLSLYSKNLAQPLRSPIKRSVRRYNTRQCNPMYQPMIRGGFDDFFFKPMTWPSALFTSPLRNEPSHIMSVLPKLLRESDMKLLKSSPGYEITESDSKYQVAIDVPGIKGSDLTVKVEMHDSQPVLHVSGTRKVQGSSNNDKNEENEDTSSFVSETTFEKHFLIGSNVDVEKMQANLSHGVLVLSAPKKEKAENPVITIPISAGQPEETKVEVKA